MNNETDTKKTVLYERHLSLGAKFVPFSGWEMPVNYSEGIISEHLHTRNNVSLFDICHMGEFRITGAGSEATLDRVVARTVKNQKNGTCRYNFLLNENGKVIDDIIVYRIGEQEFFIVVNAGTKDGDAEWFRKNLSEVNFSDESDNTAKLDLQGPESRDVLIKLGLDASILPEYYKFIITKIAGIDCILSRTGYTGELGYEIYVDTNHAVRVWDFLLSDPRVKPAGLGARDTLRLEMAYPLYGHEMNLSTTPIEAGFAKLLNIDDEREFIGKSALKQQGACKKMVGIVLDGKRAARDGAEIMKNEKKIGYISSGSYAPSMEKAVAIGFVDSNFYPAKGEQVEVFFKKNIFRGCFSDMPFYKNGTARI